MKPSTNIHTFCVPAYGESQYLDDCLSSLKKQTVSSDVIVTTSTPNHHIRQIANKYDFLCLSSLQTPGIGRDWNFAIHSARTQLVTIAHQDDVYHETYAEKFMAAHRKYPNAAIYFSNLGQIIDEKKQNINTVIALKRLLIAPFWLSRKIESGILLRMVLSLGDPIPCGSVMLNRRRLPQTFGFDETLKTNLDWLAWLNILENRGCFVRIPEILYYHRVHSDSETARGILRNDRYAEDLMIFEKLWGKTAARLLMKFYRLSHLLNKMQTSGQSINKK